MQMATHMLGTQTGPPKGSFWLFFYADLKPRSTTCSTRSQPPLLSFLLKLCVIV